MVQPFLHTPLATTAAPATTQASTPMGTPTALAVETFDPETMRDIQTKLKLAANAPDPETAQYWRAKALASKAEFKRYPTAA